MKKIAMIAALIACAPAYADTRFVIQNEGGGTINMTDKPCPNGNGLFVYSVGKMTGNALSGCYSIDRTAALIVVRWDDGKTIVFRPEDVFVVPEYKEPESGAQSAPAANPEVGPF